VYNFTCLNLDQGQIHAPITAIRAVGTPAGQIAASTPVLIGHDETATFCAAPAAVSIAPARSAAGVGPVFVSATASALTHVDHAEAGLAAGVINTFHELGAAIGVAVASTVAAVLAVGLVPPGKPQPTGVPHAC